jgi:hypothetical protein
MDAVTESTPGWTLAETVERTSDPDHSTEKPSAPSRQKIALWGLLSRGELVATGCFDTPAASPVAIAPQKFPTLDWHGSPSTTLVGVAGSDVQVFNVRVFPILRAPNAASYLNGLSLAEAFRKFVINDPEVVALAKRLLKAESRHSAVFHEGQVPGPFVSFHWPIDATASALEFRFVDSLEASSEAPSQRHQRRYLLSLRCLLIVLQHCETSSPAERLSRLVPLCCRESKDQSAVSSGSAVVSPLTRAVGIFAKAKTIAPCPSGPV